MPWLSLLGRYWPYILIAILGLVVHHYRGALIASENDYMAFRAKVEVLGEQAKLQAKLKEESYAKAITTATAGRTAALDQLRKQINTPSSHVPLTPAVAPGDTAICFDPPAFAAAVERYRSRVQGIVGSGEEAQIDARALLGSWPK